MGASASKEERIAVIDDKIKKLNDEKRNIEDEPVDDSPSQSPPLAVVASTAPALADSAAPPLAYGANDTTGVEPPPLADGASSVEPPADVAKSQGQGGGRYNKNRKRSRKNIKKMSKRSKRSNKHRL